MADEAVAAAPVNEAAPSTQTDAAPSFLADTNPVTETPEADAPAGSFLGDKPAAEADAEAKADEAEKPAEDKPPVEYSFTMPEGIEMLPEDVTGYTDLAKKYDIAPEAAQEILDFGTTRLKEAAAAPYKLWAETQSKWTGEIKSDPEIGGAKLADTKISSTVAVDAVGGDALRQALTYTGAGNNPEVVRAFNDMGKVMQAAAAAGLIKPGQSARDLTRALSSPEFASGRPVTAPARSAAEVLYPSSS